MRRTIEAVVSWHHVSLNTARHRRGSGRAWGGCVALAFVLILLPSLVKAATIIDVQFVESDGAISNLNPSNGKFDVVYSGGLIKSADGLTTFGSYFEAVPRYAGSAGSFNFFDAVAVLPGGDVYYKMVHNFADNSERGIIFGGDGTFAGTTGSITRISLHVHRVTLP